MRAVQPAIADGRHGLVDDVGRDRAERLGGGPVAQGDRGARVAAGRHRRLERDRPEQRHADLVGQRLAAALAEQRVRLAVLAA